MDENTKATGDVLIEETPIGLSADQMSKSNPAAVAEIGQAAAAAAVDQERARISELTTTFASDPEFLKACIDDGKMTVDKAKASKYDDVAAENQKLVAEVDKLKAAGKKRDTDASDDTPDFVATDDDENEPEASEGQAPDKLAKEAERIWGQSEPVRNAFGNDKEAFVSGFPTNAEEYRKLAKDLK